MGQKVNPNGFRTGINKDWRANWIAPKKDIAACILEDHKIRKLLDEEYGTKAGLNNCSISKVTIERRNATVTVNIFTSQPGMLIGQKGANIQVLNQKLQKLIGTKTLEVNVKEIKNPDIDADLVAQSVASQLERRMAWRRTMKMAIQKAMKNGVTGIKIMLSGRLDGADIARSEHYQQGVLPLHTLRSDIDYGFAEAHTTFGVIGVKCWICNGQVKGKRMHTGEVVRANKDRPSFDRNKRFNGNGNGKFGAGYTARKYEGGERKDLNPLKNSGGYSKSFVPKLAKKEVTDDVNA